MIETINTLKSISLFLLVFGFLALVAAVFVAWKFDLLDYYRVRRGKPRKVKEIKQTGVSTAHQYYSEVLSDDVSHEIVNESYMEDSEVLGGQIRLGESSDGIVNQIIDDDAVMDLGPQQQVSPDSGADETTLLPKNRPVARSYQEVTNDNAYSFDEEGADETSLLMDDNTLDGTDVVVLGDVVEDGLLDETDVVNFDEEGADETELLVDDSVLDETDVIILDSGSPVEKGFRHEKRRNPAVAKRAFEATMPTNEETTDGTTKEMFIDQIDDYKPVEPPIFEDEVESFVSAENFFGVDEGEDDEPLDPTEQLVAEQLIAEPTQVVISEPTPQQEVEEEYFETTLADVDGEGETTVLSSKKASRSTEISKRLWSKQTNVFVEDDEANTVVSFVQK